MIVSKVLMFFMVLCKLLPLGIVMCYWFCPVSFFSSFITHVHVCLNDIQMYPDVSYFTYKVKQSRHSFWQARIHLYFLFVFTTFHFESRSPSNGLEIKKPPRRLNRGFMVLVPDYKAGIFSSPVGYMYMYTPSCCMS